MKTWIRAAVALAVAATALFTPGSSSGAPFNCSGAVALTWSVSHYALEIPWRVFADEHVGGVALTAVLVGAIGVLSSLDVLRNKPLSTLRAE